MEENEKYAEFVRAHIELFRSSPEFSQLYKIKNDYLYELGDYARLDLKMGPYFHIFDDCPPSSTSRNDDVSCAYINKGFICQVVCTFHEWINVIGTHVCNNPITKVSIKGKVPFRAVDASTEIPGRTVLWRPGDFGQASCIWPEIYPYVCKYSQRKNPEGNTIQAAFHSTSAAMQALTLGCLEWAREKITPKVPYDSPIEPPEVPYDDPDFWEGIQLPDLSAPSLPDLD